MTARDQQRVLAVEADAASRRGLAVDVLVRVDEDAVARPRAPSERVELVAQLGVAVVPRVARQPSVAVRAIGLRCVVAEGGRDDGARTREQRLRMTRQFGLRHRELHVGEEPARLALGDVPLRLVVGVAGVAPIASRPSSRPSCSRSTRATRIVCRRVQAVRIHEDGGPRCSCYEDVPDPVAGPARCSIRLHASALNHLDVWIRKGLPSVPKPRILGADGAGIVEALGDGVAGFERGDRVVINPGIEAGTARST